MNAATDGLDPIEIPYGIVADDCQALIAHGNSQFPRLRKGDVIIFRRLAAIPEELIGREAIVKIVGGPVLLKTLLSGSRPNRWHLEGYNAPLRFDQEIEWVGEIQAIIPDGEWRQASPSDDAGARKRQPHA